MALNSKKGLGRGLAALIPNADMDALSDVTRESDLLSLAQRTSTPPLRPAKKGKQPAKVGKSAPNDSPRQNELLPSAPSEALSSGEENIHAEYSELSRAAQMLPLNSVIPNPYQPRRHFDENELNDLAASVKIHGILQPILVRPAENGTFQLVAGERRWRAAQRAELNEIPAIVRELPDQQALELALIENVQRHDISAIDAALAYQRLIREFRLSQEQVSRRVGKSRSAVANTMRLLDLPQEAQSALVEGSLSEGHGRAILLATGEGARRAIFRRVVRDKLSVRETERLARAALPEEKRENAKADKADTRNSSIWGDEEKSLTNMLGARVRVKSTQHRHAVFIECADREDLLRLLRDLKKS